jgi:monovalent cation:H+ antiporter-2, CPA2 family
VLADAHLERARLLVVAAPDAYQGRAILELARRVNPDLQVIARTQSDAERAWLEERGAAWALVGECELAVSLTRAALRRFGVAHDMEQVAARTLRTTGPALSATGVRSPSS